MQRPAKATPNTLGAALYRHGNLDGALAALKASIELQEGQTDPYDALFLAMVHWKLGHSSEARQWYERAEVTLNESDFAAGKQDIQAEIERLRREVQEMTAASF